MEAFADAVFALVLALLFLQAEPPHDMADLQAAMKALLPFAVTFVLLAMVWVDHHRFFHRYGLFDAPVFYGNLFLLFLVLVLAYPLKFLFTMLAVFWFGPIGDLTAQSMQQGREQLGGATLMVFYGLGFGAIYATFALLYRHALRRADDLGLDVVERHLTTSSLLECLVLVGFAAVSIALALAGSIAWSGFVYFGIGPVMGVLGWRRGVALHRLLPARAAAD